MYINVYTSLVMVIYVIYVKIHENMIYHDMLNEL